MKKGDTVRIRVEGRELEARVEVASGNKGSLLLAIGEGLPTDRGLALLGDRQALLLLYEDGHYIDLPTGRVVEVLE